MQFAILGSGSRGNASVIRDETTAVLVDCGFSRRETERRLAALEMAPGDIDAILVTHEHADHVGGVGRIAQGWSCPVWATAGTAAAAGLDELDGFQSFSPHRGFAIGTLEIAPFPVPHDAREPAQFVISAGGQRLGILSDAGTVTSHMREMLDACDALLLEFNHCTQMLADGPYPAALRARVGGGLGHLSNAQSAELLGALDRSRLRQLVVTHISEKNNTAERALDAAAQALGARPDWLAAAEQDCVTPWRDLM